jgi:hypothetical protein
MEPTVGRLTYQKLVDYVKQQLGQGIFTVELTQDQIDNCITDALTLYSSRKPMVGYRAITVNPQIKTYKLDHDIGFGIFHVSFVQPDPQPSALFYANLLDVAPVKPASMESYDIFLRWRKTFMRVTSVANRWEYDEMSNSLMIYCPIEQTKACYFWHAPRKIEQIKIQHTNWVKSYTLAKAKDVLGKARSKFQGILPGPARDLNLNGDSLQAEAKEEIATLEASLLTMQGDQPPLIG